MKRVLLAFALCLFAFLSQAQQPQKEPAYRLMEAMQLNESISKMIDVMAQMPGIASANVPSEVWEEFKKEFTSESMMDEIAPIYAKYYTEAELLALIDFYNSPIGKKTLEVTPAITQESMVVGQKKGQEVMGRIIEKLQKMGYTQSSL